MYCTYKVVKLNSTREIEVLYTVCCFIDANGNRNGSIQHNAKYSVKSGWTPLYRVSSITYPQAYVTNLMCSSFQFQCAANRGDREDSGHDGRRDRVRELHLRERRGTVRGHRSRHDHGE